MANIFEVTAEMRKIMQDAQDDIIDQMGKKCRVYYTPKMIDCNNCTTMVVGGVTTNKYLHGGPMQFSDFSVCPMCNSAGKIAQESYSDIQMYVVYNQAKYKIAGGNILIPDGGILTKGYMTDLPKVMNATHINFIDLQPLRGYNFVLSGEPSDYNHIVHGRYFTAIWQRQ